MDAALIGGVLTLFSSAIGALAVFVVKLFLILERTRHAAELSDRRCEARMNIRRRKEWYYERELGRLQRATGLDVNRTELAALDDMERRVLIGDLQALGEATA